MAVQPFRMESIFGPAPQQDERFMDMPAYLPTKPMNPMSPPLINRATSSQTPGTYEDLIEADAIADNPQAYDTDSLLEAFRQNVLNPPKRTQMTYPKSTLNTLEAALKIAAEPSPLEKNRIYIGGHPYQKQRVYTDPVTGEQKFITTVKEPSFGSQVMRAMAAGGMEGPIDVLNQQRADELADWELKNKGLAQAIGAESQMALAQQRQAQAGYTGQRAGLEQQKIDINRMTAEERMRVSRLNTLTDQQKLQMLQDGRISLAELQAAEAMKRVQEQQKGATERTNIQQQAATGRTRMQQEGATSRNQASIEAAQRRVETQQEGANARAQARINASGAARGLSPTQNRVEIQRRAAEFINDNPDLEEAIEWDDRGFPRIVHDDPDIQQMMEDKIYGPLPKDINLPSNVPTAVTPSGQVAPIGTPNMQMHPNAPVAPTAPANKPPAKPAPKAAPITPPQVIKQYSPSRNQTRISTDGGKTWTIVPGRQ